MIYKINKYYSDTDEFYIIKEALDKIGCQLTIEELPDGSEGIVLELNTTVYTKTTNRFAGRPTIGTRLDVKRLDEIPVTEIKLRIKELGADVVAHKLGMSRRSLYYRLANAKKNGQDYIEGYWQEH